MVEIQTSPNNDVNNFVMVGFAARLDPTVVNNYLNPYNYSFYCSDGLIYAETKVKQPYFKKVNRGQKVRSYLDLDDGQIFFAIDDDVNDLGPINVNPEIVRDSRLFFTVHFYTNQDSVTIMQAPDP